MSIFNAATGARNSKQTAPKRRVQTTLTRPADTTAYTAGDAVSNSTSAPTAISLADVVDINGGSGAIVEVMLECNLATVTNGTFRVYFFNTTFTPNNDNAAFDKLHANGAYLQGYVDLPILVADSSSAAAAATRITVGQGGSVGVGGGDDGLPLRFTCASGDNDLYVVIVATGAYTPSSGEVFRLSVVVEPDM
jgi:hypothetical protein